ncbi:MAG TPA: hypothetical protein PKD37_04265 [Oligoflexia bacterium]|nr:hypothetical protein [Oligoflexia bacterium]HMP27181.1 hypothetical protein [Oligoflexia bacterium]
MICHIKGRLIFNARQLHNSHGVVLPLVAAIAFGVLFLIFTLGFEAPRVKLARVEAQSELDHYCEMLAVDPTNHRQAALSFKNAMNYFVESKRLRYSRIVGANLIMPTMPADVSPAGGMPFRSDDEVNDTASFPPVLAGAGRSFAELLGEQNRCELYGGGDCYFYGDLTPIKTGVAEWRYPSSVWSNLLSAGNAIGCELVLRVPGVFLGERQFKVKTIYQKRLRAERPVYDPANPIATSPALVIAVAPHLPVAAWHIPWDNRFSFDDQGIDADYRYGDSFRRLYDPYFRNFQSPQEGDPDPFVAFGGIQPQKRFALQSGVAGDIPTVPIISNVTALDGLTRVPSYGQQEPDPLNFTPNSKIFTDRESIFLSCVNPLILVRNTLLATLAELAGRDASLRNMTEVLMVATKHRAANLALNNISNPPVIIAPFGSDLLRTAYYQPFVFYNSGFTGAEYPNPASEQLAQFFNISGYAKNGWIWPFSQTFVNGVQTWSDSAPSWRGHHALVANQLRYCFHLYGGSEQLGGGTAEIERFANGFDFLDNSGFEPLADYHSPPYNGGHWRSLRATQYYPVTAPPRREWDQACYSADSACDPAVAQAAPALSAPEILATLGAVQNCPRLENNPAIFPTTSQLANMYPNTYGQLSQIAPCPLTLVPSGATSSAVGGGGGGGNNGMRNFELRGDTMGLLRYLRGELQGIESPGFFPVPDPAVFDSNPQYPFIGVGGGVYSPVANLDASLVLVLHQLPEEVDMAAHRNKVRDLLLSSPARRIFIFYLPFLRSESVNLGSLNAAFLPEEPELAERVRIMNISPYDKSFGPACNGPGEPLAGDPEPTLVEEAAHFRNFWACLLNDEDAGIIAIARRFFLSDLTFLHNIF